MESDSSETNLIIITKRDRLILFCKLYWRALIVFLTPLILLPIAFIEDSKAYKCLYVFLLCSVYWLSDAIHPSVVAIVPIALSSVMGSVDHGFMSEAYLRNELLDCASVMMINLAIEECMVHRRVALKLLLIFGCSHYRHPRPTDFTIFYFLGIAYSSTIELACAIAASASLPPVEGHRLWLKLSRITFKGSSATLMGSQANQILKIYCESLFPTGPKIEFPRFLLLNLPGVIVMETILYFWMNFHFLGMFRTQNNLSLEIGMTEEEAHYINTLLATEYQLLGKLKVHEAIVGSIAVFTAILQATMSSAYITSTNYIPFHNHFKVSSTSLLAVFALFVIPKDVEFMKFFKRRSATIQPLPQNPCKTCLQWFIVRDNLFWSVLFIIGGSSILLESLKDSGMTDEFENLFTTFQTWPVSMMALILILFFKIMSEFAPNSTIAYCFLPNIAKLAIRCGMNPYYLMMSATLALAQPFHLITATPTHAMVASYVHIPPGKMMSAGVGLSVASILVVWFNVATWSTAVWPDIAHYPVWTRDSVFARQSILVT